MSAEKIDLSTPKETLFAIWEELFRRENQLALERHPDRHPSRDYFFDYRIAREQLEAGRISKTEIDAMLMRFDTYEGDLSDLTNVARLWYRLSLKYPTLVDGQMIKTMWWWGIEKLPDPIQKAGEMGNYLLVIKPKDVESLLTQAADLIREKLPVYELVPQKYPLESDEDDEESESAEDFSRISDFLSVCRELGFAFTDLDQYLLDALSVVDLTRCNTYVTYYLMDHMLQSGLPDDEKKRLLEITMDRLAVLPDEVRARIDEGAISVYLKLGEFESALGVWRGVSDWEVASYSLGDLCEFALLHGRAEELRRELPDYKNNAEDWDDDDYLIEWARHWFTAAYFLSDKGKYFMEEPEVIAWLQSDYGIDDLERAWLLAQEEKFRGKTGKLMRLVASRVRYYLDQYNQGELESLECRALLKALMAMA